MLIRPAQSLEFMLVPVAGSVAGVTLDPTTDPVGFAFLPEGSPVTVSTTFITGDWETDATSSASPIYYARLLVGPTGDYQPTAGTSVDTYVKVTDSPEAPIEKAGTVRFT